MLVKRLLYVFVVFVVGAIVFLVTLPDDIPPFDDAHLRRPIETVPDEHNAFTFYSQAGAAMVTPTDINTFDDILAGTLYDEQFIRELLDSNATSMSLVRQGNQFDRCLAPRVTSLEKLLPYIAPLRGLGRLFLIETRNRIHKQEPTEALTAIFDMQAFAERCEANASCLILYLAATALRQMEYSAARDLVHSGLLDDDQLRSLCEHLASSPPSTSALALAWQTEYEVFANFIDNVAAGELNVYSDSHSDDSPTLWQRWFMKFFLHPNRTKQDMATFFGELISHVEDTYADTELTDVDTFIQQKRQRIDNARGLAKFRVPNPVGIILYNVMLPSSQGVIQRKCDIQTSHRVTLVLAAMQRSILAHDNLPMDLQSLVPESLATIPHDPYDGQPLRYSRDKAIVYSVGKDLKDQGGSIELPFKGEPYNPIDHQWKTADLVFSVGELSASPSQ